MSRILAICPWVMPAATASRTVAAKPSRARSRAAPRERSRRPGHDALRLLLARVGSAPADTCRDPGGYALTFGSTLVCWPRGTPEFRSVVRLLEGVFDV